MTDKQLQQLIKYNSDLEDTPAESFKEMQWLKDFYSNGMTYWSAICKNLLIDDHIRLLKTVVLVGEVLGFSGGSVAAPIWIYRILDEKIGYEKSCELADWVVSHCKDDWIPFGSSVKRSMFQRIPKSEYALGSGSLYWDLSLEENSKISIKRCQTQKLEEQQAKSKHNRLEQHARNREKHLAQRDKLARERVKLLQSITDNSPLQRLTLVAEEPKKPIQYFPEEWANISEPELSEIPTSIFQKLLEKTQKVSEGPWKNLHLKLESLKK